MRQILRRGFTLLELLIAIAIIAILVSILLPMLARSREMANRIACLSNIHQLTTAWIAYANENKGAQNNARPVTSTSDPDWAQYLAWFKGEAPPGDYAVTPLL